MPPVIPDKLPCESLQQLEQELSTLRNALSLEETEETWDRIARALTRFSAVVKGGGYKYEKELVNGIRSSAKPIVSAMNSERTRLSAAALDCLIIIAPRVGLAFDTLVPLFMPHILRLATRTNKVYVTRSQTGLALIISYCHIPSIIPCLLSACKESRIVTGRAVALEGVLRSLNKWDWTQREIKAKIGDVEEAIRLTGRDKDAGIRQTSRKVFETYKALFPDRVDEFTGPLTPVMRKYLDVKPQNLSPKAIERARSPSAQLKMNRRPPTKLDFSKSTSIIPAAASSNARAGIKTHGKGASSNSIVAAGFMPPPASIPLRASAVSRSQAQSPDPDNQSDQHTDHERQRVLSTASSTFSIKSAPSNPRHEYQHKPPGRLAASQSHAKMASSVMAASSGQARRVRRVAAVEPHPANRPGISTVVPKTPMRPTPLAGVSFPLQTPARVPTKDPVGVMQSASVYASGIVLPTSEPESVPTAIERKGAQRVLKPVPPSSPPQVDRPETVMSDNVKQETKPSIFRRGAPEEKKNEKSKERFVPRRGGGVMQPTLSQLNKQKTLPSADGTAEPVRGRTMASTSVVSKRPIWGAGTKPTASKGLPGSRVVSQNGVTKDPVAKQNDPVTVTEAQPATVPLLECPPAAGDSDTVAPPAVELSGSPKAQEAVEEETKETKERVECSPAAEVSDTIAPPAVELSGSPKAQEAVEETTETKERATSDEASTAETSDVAQGSTGSEMNSDEIRTDKAQEVAHEPNNEDRQYAHTNGVNEIKPPCTPPFPSTEDETDEDELDAIEFTTGEAYDSAGLPIKTPGKGVRAATGVAPDRNPLAEVVLNG